ncbi:hypothetical protein H6G89_03180 [Oscillatoria sp. FACHB-1407]|uniref:hypothetical protein n=1 Tax=Oscillatoria sp. FACHB-1407 TaxID=2692847 RepID=UPI00168460CE|nr:hypothetical protein [Oscillatoria sp. FACHB-1407]MBD2460039.1 hypothetical protein [Oscillatoria sp. FACHB-1407]
MRLLHTQSQGLRDIKRPVSVLLSGVVVSAIALVNALPVRADGVVVRGGSVTVQVGEYNPPRSVYSRDYDRDYRDRYYRDRYYRDRYDDRYDTEIEDSLLINPVIIDSEIEDSVLIDPVIINSGYGYDYDDRDVRIYSTGGTRPTCQVLSNFRAACN